MLRRENFFKITPSKEYGDNGLNKKISSVVEGYEMLRLPNKPKLTKEEVRERAVKLSKQYEAATRSEYNRLLEVKTKISNLFNRKDARFSKAKEILQKTPLESIICLVKGFSSLPEEVQEEFASLALENTPLEATIGLNKSLRFLPEGTGIRRKIIRLLIEKSHPEERGLVGFNLKFLPEEVQVENARLALKEFPKSVADIIAINLEYLSEGKQVEIAGLLLEAAPEEVIPILVGNLWELPIEIKEKIAGLVLKETSKEDTAEITEKFDNLPEGKENLEKIAHLLLEKAPKETVIELARNLNSWPEKYQEKIARLALKESPKEAALALVRKLAYLTGQLKKEIVDLVLKESPKEAAPALALNLPRLPEEMQLEIARLLLKKAPQEAASELTAFLYRLPEEMQLEIARLAFKAAPQKAAFGLVECLEYLSAKVREEFENSAMEIIETTEQKELLEAENRNPALYKRVGDSEEVFLRKEFPKTGTKTLLLGKTLINNAILRIIPNHAFIGWVDAYSAVETWKKAGFDYVPIEPILKASLSNDGKNTRVYSGVLGVSVAKYLKMLSRKKYHENVKKQTETIIKTLEEMDITHGHTHLENFCILHERNPEGNIDWDRPPRVYCIDFDRSVSGQKSLR